MPSLCQKKRLLLGTFISLITKIQDFTFTSSYIFKIAPFTTWEEDVVYLKKETAYLQNFCLPIK